MKNLRMGDPADTSPDVRILFRNIVEFATQGISCIGFRPSAGVTTEPLAVYSSPLNNAAKLLCTRALQVLEVSIEQPKAEATGLRLTPSPMSSRASDLSSQYSKPYGTGEL